MAEFVQHYNTVLKRPVPSSVVNSLTQPDAASFEFSLMPPPDLTDETFPPMLDLYHEHLLKCTSSVQHSLSSGSLPQGGTKGL
jgi:hypothetical protein